jgi:HPt (histidine-containing phosphotransfer) domain-containing protein
MSKPVDRMSLLWMVARQTNHTLQTRAIAFAEQPAPRSVDAIPASSSPANGPIRSQLAQDPEFAGVLARFVSRLPLRAAELGRLAKLGVSKTLAETAHKLRGAAGTYGLAEISTAAGVVEDRLIAGDAIEKVGVEIESLIALMRRVDGYDRTAEAGPASFSEFAECVLSRK